MVRFLILYFFLGCYVAFAQQQQQDAWLFFKNKPSAEVYLSNPRLMLSKRALERRKRYNIPLDNTDVPFEGRYYNRIAKIKGVRILAKSKWLNALHVQATKRTIDSIVNTLDIVLRVEYADKTVSSKIKQGNFLRSKKAKYKQVTINENSYGLADHQIEMLNGKQLHHEGYKGKGIQIAIIDAGFPNVNSMKSFRKLRDNSQLLGGYNFVSRNRDFYSGISHGTSVLSTIGGNLENKYIGTAPEASFYLFVTEDASKEVPLEESLWVEAAELSDSLGVDIINTSLGYNTFDNSNYDYNYNDLDGKTTFISRGAQMATSKGMLVVAAAGNSGNLSWKYISAPADCKDVLTVGAVDADEEIASFSSYGPTSDGRIKPDIVAQGKLVNIIDVSDSVRETNGTSFASPIIAGLAACLWQAYPEKNNKEIIAIIKKSADKKSKPNNRYGYGIPNFYQAFNTLGTNYLPLDFLKVYPNPAKSKLNLKFKKHLLKQYMFEISNVLGVVVEEGVLLKQLDVSNLFSGVYFLKIYNDSSQKTIQFIKQ